MISEEDKQKYMKRVEKFLTETKRTSASTLQKYHIIIEADLYNHGNIKDCINSLNIEINGTEKNIKYQIYEVLNNE